MYITKENVIFSANNARQAALRVNISTAYEVLSDESGNIIKDQYGHYIYTGNVFRPSVFFKMAKTLNPNIDMSKPITKGTRVFDWENSITFKLTNDEIAILSMLSNPYYIERWNSILVEQNQNNKKELYSFFHSSKSQQVIESKTLSVYCNKKNDNNISVLLVATHTKNNAKDKITLSLKIHQAHMLGLAMTGFLMSQSLHNIRIRDITQTFGANVQNDDIPEEEVIADNVIDEDEHVKINTEVITDDDISSLFN